jgi:hypothetical protein
MVMNSSNFTQSSSSTFCGLLSLAALQLQLS